MCSIHRWNFCTSISADCHPLLAGHHMARARHSCPKNSGKQNADKKFQTLSTVLIYCLRCRVIAMNCASLVARIRAASRWRSPNKTKTAFVVFNSKIGLFRWMKPHCMKSHFKMFKFYVFLVFPWTNYKLRIFCGNVFECVHILADKWESLWSLSFSSDPRIRPQKKIQQISLQNCFLYLEKIRWNKD